jgi:fumarylacetoacetase
MSLNATHDPALQSWVPSAQAAEGDFPIQNLPHGVFRRRGSNEAFRGGVAIGDQILDLAQAVAAGVFADAVLPAAQAAAAPQLNGLMALGPAAWHSLRAELSRLLRVGAPEAALLSACLLPQEQAEHALPAHIGDYTDFFTSWQHMVNAGRIFNADAPPLQNFSWLPIAYHGRASTVEVSGASFQRPRGISRPAGGTPVFGPTTGLDYEMELACWVGPGNRRGEPIAVDAAEDHIFGVGLLNDWSARDVQAFESMPLGPFLGKNFLTSVSPWIVTLEALAPFRCALPRTAADPPTLPHLRPANAQPGLDLELEVTLQTAKSGGTAYLLSRSNARHGWWALSQMLAHHTEGGCSLQPGDLIGTGTQSGPTPGEEGCLLELSRGGRQAVELGNGETRRFLEDGDTVTLRAWAQRPGARRIGLGRCVGTVLPARPA